MKRFLLLLTAPLLFACSQDDDPIACTDEFVYGLNIVVRDSDTNEILKDLVLTAQDGNYSEELMTEESFDSFFGAGERAGNYTITITGDGYVSFVSDVVEVRDDACHVIPESREYMLSPN